MWSASWLADLFWDKREFLTDYALQFCEKGRESRAADFVRSMEKAAEIYSQFGPVMEGYNLFICPTTAIPAVPAGFNQAKDELVINGKSLNPILGWVMTTPFNTMGKCPVLSLPSGRAQNGVPTGIQLVGRTFCDTDVFRAGVSYENAVGGWFNGDETRPYL
jgi:amidase